MGVLTVGLVALVLSSGCTGTDGEPSSNAATTNTPPPETQPSWSELCPESPPSDPRSPLRFSIKYGSREVSRDSHSSRLSAVFDGHLLTLNGPYGKCVRGRCEHKEVAFVPTAEEIAAVQDQLTRHSLWEDLVEVDDTEFRGPHSTTTMSLEMSDGQRTVSSNVKHGTGFTTGRERTRTGSEVAHARSSAARRVIMGLRTTALRCFPDYHTN